ncbi:hypothetical protein SAMN02745751_00492 [Dethiosulfatibacter aminovorans DSM 17477]|uniref:Uncharacterized protein n=1 Tax=Dethiosulfatibacter aminovorans DSM 17477 TaxID=1121476 RepID=A0A1M6BVQ7_9FIRM|nr:DUF948 domain-containing protein [Dethiosulfatibacter aminovorans]SHI52872.1 hypothetical protein SAMN02745751_00492 [Dethiosulfatibacter aminovorans DSM 17477]
MKNRIGSIIASIFLLVVVGALVYMFYIQTVRIKDLRKEVESLESTIEVLEGEKAEMETSMDAMAADVEEKNEQIEKLNGKIEILNDNVNSISAIRKILEENFGHDEGAEDEAEANFESISFLDMSEDELMIYESFKEEYNDEMLTAVEPFTIMKLYLYCSYIKDYETQYELYVNHEDYDMSWTKEEHMNIPEEHRISDFGEFETAYNVEVKVEGAHALVLWNSDYDGEEEFKYGFNLDKDENGIWKVNFIPMQ